MGVISTLQGWLGGGLATSNYLVGIGGTYPVTQDAREMLPSVVRGIQLISGDLARLDVEVHGERNSPALSLLRDEANPHMTGQAWRAWMVATAILRGSAYSWVQRDAQGDAVALWPLLPGRAQVIWTGGEPRWLLDGRQLDPHMIIALMSGAGDPINPYRCDSPLAKCAPALSLAVMQERVATALAQGGRVGKISITHPGTLSTAAKMDLLDAYSRKHISPEGATRPLVLDEGVRVERVGDGGAPGLTDDRRFAIMEVARCLSIPPQMLYQGDAGALTSQIEMQRQYVEQAVLPWSARFADALSCKLLGGPRRFRFATECLVRGNLRDLAASLKDLASTGAVTINDARQMLGLPPMADGGADPIRPLSLSAPPVQHEADP